MVKVGIVRCAKDFECSGCNCFYSAKKRDGSFRTYPKEETIEIVGITPCGICKGRNIDDDLLKVKKYGAEAIHISSCHLAVYPPCPLIAEHKRHFEELLGVPVRVGTHPLPKSYVDELCVWVIGGGWKTM